MRRHDTVASLQITDTDILGAWVCIYYRGDTALQRSVVTYVRHGAGVACWLGFRSWGFSYKISGDISVELVERTMVRDISWSGHGEKRSTLQGRWWENGDSFTGATRPLTAASNSITLHPACTRSGGDQGSHSCTLKDGHKKR